MAFIRQNIDIAAAVAWQGYQDKGRCAILDGECHAAIAVGSPYLGAGCRVTREDVVVGHRALVRPVGACRRYGEARADGLDERRRA